MEQRGREAVGVELADYGQIGARALDILADMYKNSLFSEEDIEREKQVINQEIKMVEDICKK